MANDKNFKIKNGLSAKRYLLNGSTLSGSTIDLSLASVFSTTLSSDPAYTFTNPPPSGTAAAFSVEVTGGTTTFTQDSFATTVYAGNGTSQTITNGLDLANDGGLVWIKSRGDNNAGPENHQLFDTNRGANKVLQSNSDLAEATYTQRLTAFNTNGFSIGSDYDVNNPNPTFASWAFKKQAKFFDVVTWTGDGTTDGSKTVSHNLGVEPAVIIIKCTDIARKWVVFTDVIDGTIDYLVLNDTAAALDGSALLSKSSSSFNLLTNGTDFNGDGFTYVAYLFAHDTASDSRIKCGSYSSTGLVNLGWKPQWLLIKSTTNTSDYTGDWRIFDNKRGVIAGDDNQLFANSNRAEDTATFASAVEFVNTGFNVESQGNYGTSTIYIAIRDDSATDSAITWPSSVKWPSGLAPTTPAPGLKDLFTFLTTDGGTTYYGKKAGSDIA
jgi:hypothetical protein